MHRILTLFFFNHPPTTEISTLSLHAALPIFAAATGWDGTVLVLASGTAADLAGAFRGPAVALRRSRTALVLDRKSTRLNSSHANISYAVFCLKKKKKSSHTICCIPAFYCQNK